MTPTQDSSSSSCHCHHGGAGAERPLRHDSSSWFLGAPRWQRFRDACTRHQAFAALRTMAMLVVLFHARPVTAQTDNVVVVDGLLHAEEVVFFRNELDRLRVHHRAVSERVCTLGAHEHTCLVNTSASVASRVRATLDEALQIRAASSTGANEQKALPVRITFGPVHAHRDSAWVRQRLPENAPELGLDETDRVFGAATAYSVVVYLGGDGALVVGNGDSAREIEVVPGRLVAFPNHRLLHSAYGSMRQLLGPLAYIPGNHKDALWPTGVFLGCWTPGVPGNLLLPGISSSACNNLLYLNLLHVNRFHVTFTSAAAVSAASSSNVRVSTDESSLFPYYAAFSSAGFLDAGGHSFNIATNQGFNIILIARFSGAAAEYETVFSAGDSSNGGMRDGIWLGRNSYSGAMPPWGTGNTDILHLKVLNNGSVACEIMDPSTPIVQEQWFVVTLSYDATATTTGQLKMRHIVNGQPKTATSTCTVAIVDFQAVQTFVGKSPCTDWALSNQTLVTWHDYGAEGEIFQDLGSAQARFDQKVQLNLFARIYDKALGIAAEFGYSPAIISTHGPELDDLARSMFPCANESHQPFGGDIAALLVTDSDLSEQDYIELANHMSAFASAVPASCGMHLAATCLTCTWYGGIDYGMSYCNGDCEWNSTHCALPGAVVHQTTTPQSGSVAVTPQPGNMSAAMSPVAVTPSVKPPEGSPATSSAGSPTTPALTTPSPSTTAPSQQCPKHSESDNETGCRCFEGYYAIYSGFAGNQTTESCVLEGSVTPQQARDTAQSVSAVVGAAIATAVGSAVVTSVTTALGSTVAGTAASAVGTGGAGTASSSAGSSAVLISQVQVLNLMGRIGGSNASEGMKSFTDGFGWANFDVGLRLSDTGEEKRRSKKTSSFDSDDLDLDQDDEEGGDGEVPCVNNTNVTVTSVGCDGSGDECSFSEIAPSIEKIVTCLVVLCACSVVRVLLGVLCTRPWKPPDDRKEWPDSLLFPAWEAPIILAQFMALCDAPIQMMVLLCDSWVAVGITMLLLGPFFMIFSAYALLRRHMGNGSVVFVQCKSVQQRGFVASMVKENVKRQRGPLQKFFGFTTGLSLMRERGEWMFEDECRGWGFILSDVCGYYWIFALWRLLKKLFLTLALSLTEGRSNAILALVIQLTDTLTILSARPLINRDDDLVESVGAVLNLFAFGSLAAPMLLPNSSWMSEHVAMALALGPTLFAAVASFCPFLVAAIKLLSSSEQFLEWFGVARDGIILFTLRLAEKSGEAAQRRIEQKLERAVDSEGKSVRLQLLVRTAIEDIRDPIPVPVVSKRRAAAEKVGFTSPICELKEYSIVRAMAFAANAKSQDVQVAMQEGERYALWIDRLKERSVLDRDNENQGLPAIPASGKENKQKKKKKKTNKEVEPEESMEIEMTSARNFGRSPSISNGQGSANGSLKSGSSKHSVDSAVPPSDTTELDIIINAGSHKDALAMIDRLTARAIDFALKAYGIEEAAHILLEATLQCDFPPHAHPWLQMHQLSAHASAAMLQSLCRRRADQHTYRRDLKLWRKEQQMPEYIFDAQCQQIIVKPRSQSRAVQRDLAFDEVSSNNDSSSDDSSSFDSALESSTDDTLSDCPDEGEKEGASHPHISITPVLVQKRDIPNDLRFPQKKPSLPQQSFKSYNQTTMTLEDRLYSPRNMNHMAGLPRHTHVVSLAHPTSRKVYDLASAKPPPSKEYKSLLQQHRDALATKVDLMSEKLVPLTVRERTIIVFGDVVGECVPDTLASVQELQESGYDVTKLASWTLSSSTDVQSKKRSSHSKLSQSNNGTALPRNGGQKAKPRADRRVPPKAKPSESRLALGERAMVSKSRFIAKDREVAQSHGGGTEEAISRVSKPTTDLRKADVA